MNVSQWLVTFMHDDKLKTVLVLIAVDFILGVAAAVKGGTFRLSYVAQFAKDDLLGKVVPWFVLYAAALVAGHTTILPGVYDIGDAASTLWGIVVAALGGSIIKSLGDFGVPVPKVLK